MLQLLSLVPAYSRQSQVDLPPSRLHTDKATVFSKDHSCCALRLDEPLDPSISIYPSLAARKPLPRVTGSKSSTQTRSSRPLCRELEETEPVSLLSAAAPGKKQPFLRGLEFLIPIGQQVFSALFWTISSCEHHNIYSSLFISSSASSICTHSIHPPHSFDLRLSPSGTHFIIVQASCSHSFCGHILSLQGTFVQTRHSLIRIITYHSSKDYRSPTWPLDSSAQPRLLPSLPT